MLSETNTWFPTAEFSVYSVTVFVPAETPICLEARAEKSNLISPQ